MARTKSESQHLDLTLLHYGINTAKTIATECGVARRTAWRRLEALRMCGLAAAAIGADAYSPLRRYASGRNGASYGSFSCPYALTDDGRARLEALEDMLVYELRRELDSRSQRRKSRVFSDRGACLVPLLMSCGYNCGRVAAWAGVSRTAVRNWSGVDAIPRFKHSRPDAGIRSEV